ncbi:MAG: zinc ABC transporter substrate-binding protein, partial [Clostridiales bacterium]|nr:zinc ABC transporter substrate-binding protein [Clostridiales bacterium]
MKRIIALIITVLLICSAFAGCGADEKAAPDTPNTNADTKNTSDASAGEKLNVVTTIFPEYDWVRQIAQDKADITMLLDNGVDLHSYQPTADDIVKISTCDMFIYVGGESDEWVEDVLAEAQNKDMAVINLLESLGDSVKEEEVVEGMEAEHDHDHEHEEIEEEDIKDRALSEFEGEWKSLYPLLEAGKLEEFLEHKAEDA